MLQVEFNIPLKDDDLIKVNESFLRIKFNIQRTLERFWFINKPYGYSIESI